MGHCGRTTLSLLLHYCIDRHTQDPSTADALLDAFCSAEQLEEELCKRQPYVITITMGSGSGSNASSDGRVEGRGHTPAF
jgi:hypothetical protein